MHQSFQAAVLVLAAGVLAAPDRAAAFLGDPLPGLTPEQLHLFELGKEAFEEEESIEDGIGPVFNEASCVACHNVPATGGSSDRLETRFGRYENGVFDPLKEHGGSLMQDQGIGPVGECNYRAEVTPSVANVVARRRATPLFGLGLVDAVPDGTFIILSFLQSVFTPATAGKVSYTIDPMTGKTVVGKLGWKAQVPSLFVFSGDAYLNEMGITTPMFPDENCPGGDCASLACNPAADPNDDGLDDLEAFTDFMAMLAPPPRKPVNALASLGSAVFNAVGCADCHVRRFTTGPSADPVYNRVSFEPFSDFLLHDMGSLGDGIEQGAAKPREMRTAPLWGLSSQPTLLHDGRALTPEQAILAHDGQGRASRNEFVRLSPPLKRALLAFLDTL